MKILPFLLAAALMAGCSARPPVDPNAPPPTAEEIARSNKIKCNVVMSLSASGKLAAAFTIKPDTDQTTVDIVASLVQGVDSARDAYCNAVLTGQPVDDQMAAFEAFNKVLDELTERTLAARINPGP